MSHPGPCPPASFCPPGHRNPCTIRRSDSSPPRRGGSGGGGLRARRGAPGPPGVHLARAMEVPASALLASGFLGARSRPGEKETKRLPRRAPWSYATGACSSSPWCPRAPEPPEPAGPRRRAPRRAPPARRNPAARLALGVEVGYARRAQHDGRGGKGSGGWCGVSPCRQWAAGGVRVVPSGAVPIASASDVRLRAPDVVPRDLVLRTLRFGEGAGLYASTMSAVSGGGGGVRRAGVSVCVSSWAVVVPLMIGGGRGTRYASM